MKKSRKEESFIRQPKYPGGKEALQQFLSKEMRYPKEAAEHNISGTVKIKIDINHKGKVINTTVVSGIGYGCDEEAARLAKLLQYDVPKHRGVKIVFHKTIQLHFKPPQKKGKQLKSTRTITYQLKQSTQSEQPAHTSTQKKQSYGYTIRIKK